MGEVTAAVNAPTCMPKPNVSQQVAHGDRALHGHGVVERPVDPPQCRPSRDVRQHSFRRLVERSDPWSTSTIGTAAVIAFVVEVVRNVVVPMSATGHV
jgi:hypothetical protein